MRRSARANIEYWRDSLAHNGNGANHIVRMLRFCNVATPHRSILSRLPSTWLQTMCSDAGLRRDARDDYESRLLHRRITTTGRGDWRGRGTARCERIHSHADSRVYVTGGEVSGDIQLTTACARRSRQVRSLDLQAQE